MTNEKLPEEELLKGLEAATRENGLSPSEGEFAEMGLAWKTLAKGLKQQERELAEDQMDFAERLKGVIAGDTGEMDWTGEAKLPQVPSELPQGVVSRKSHQKTWNLQGLVWVGTGVCAAAIAILMWSVWPAGNRGIQKQPVAKVPETKGKTEGLVNKKTSPKKAVEVPKVAKGTPAGGKKNQAGKQQGVVAKAKGTEKWTDPLDTRIQAAATKLRKKPVALAGTTDHSLKKLDKRVSALAKSMSQEKL